MICDRCGFDNPSGFRFCGACGARLQSLEVGHAQERKTISALFCDVVDSTRQAESLDPEAVHRVLVPYFERVRSELSRFGGTVEKFIGDAVCGFFGAPRAHGDDPERAVRAALAVADWVADRNQAEEPELHIRLGIATGEALVALGALSGAGEAMAWGDVTNSAFRIQAAAPVDGVLVDEATYRSTRHVIDYGEAEPVRAKGKTEPILVWQALAPRARRGVDLSQAGSEPFVGRAEELTQLRESLERVGRERTPELITLLGEPGIGKSRLVLELFRWIEQNPALIRWRQSHSSPYGDGFAFWALGEIVKAQAGILETDGAATAADKLGLAVREVVSEPDEAAGIEAHLRSLVGIGAPAEGHGDQRHAAFTAWRRFLEAVAREHTLVLVFEDIHCADGGLLDFIEYLLEWARGVAILVVCTARIEALAEVRPDWGKSALGIRREFPRTIELWPLSRHETGRLVAELTGGAIARKTKVSIVGAASGNPLYAVEYVRMLEDRPGEELAVPETVQAIIASRLDSLSARDKALLQDGAVVGRVVWPGALAAIGGRSKASVDRHLRDLVRKEFLIGVRPSSVGGEPEFKFRHALVRDVAYEQIPHVRRGEMHRRAAEWLEELSPDRTTDRSEMLAHHYLAAYELARGGSADTAELSERARLSLRDAGLRALSLNAFPAAERYFRAALDLWPEDDAELPSLLLRLGQARYYANTEGADVLAEAERLLLAAGDRESAAEAATSLADLAHQRGEPFEVVFEHAHRALALVKDRPLSRAKVEVLVELALFLGLAAEHERAIGLAAQALVDAEALDLEELQARALATRGISRGLSGDPGGRADLERSIEIAERIGSSLSSLHCGMLADLEGSLGNLAQCFELQERARGHAQRFGHASHIQWFRGERVAECYWSGLWDEALGLADEIVCDGDSGARHFMEAYCRDMRGRIRLAKNDVAGALDDGAEALSQAQVSNEPQMLYPALAFCARALAVAGGHDEAGRVADELMAQLGSKPNLFPASSWVVDLAYALGHLGRQGDLAQAVAEGAGSSAWLDAALAFSAGEFELAAELFAGIGSRPDEALAYLRAAEALAEAGDDPGDSGQLDRALSFFRDVEAEAFVARVRGLLDRKRAHL